MANVLELPEGNHVLGAGRIMFKRSSEEQFSYLAESPEFTITVANERVELISSDGAVAERLENVITQITRSSSLTFNQVDAEMFALFFAGTVTTETDAGASHTQRVSSVETTNSYYNLGDGVTGAPVFGHRNVENVVVTQDPDGTPAVLTVNDDYEVDAERGVVKIVPGGALSDGDVIDIDYDTVASTTEVVTTGADASVVGELWFIADNTVGDNRDFYFPKVDLGPSGDLSLKSRDTWQQIPMELEILDPDGATAAAYILAETVAS